MTKSTKQDDRLSQEVDALRKRMADLEQAMTGHDRRPGVRRDEGVNKVAMVDALEEVVVLHDRNLRIQCINQAGVRLSGLSEEEIIGKFCYQVWHGADVACDACPVKHSWKTGESHSGERVLKDGRIWHTRTYPVRSDMGEITGVMEIIQDVTDKKTAEDNRRKLEQQLQELQRQESLCVLSGGLAHDFNNLLQSILGNAARAARSIEKDTPVFEILKRIELAASRASDLTHQMLNFSRQTELQFSNLFLADLANEMLDLLRAGIPRKVQIDIEAQNSSLVVAADAGQLRQILMNLVLNAAEAIGNAEGLVTIRTGQMEVDRAYLARTHLGGDLPIGPYVFLEVEDNGAGMSDDTVAEIFNPFFSTKASGRGLGLAVVQDAVRRHKGTLHIDSKPGLGTSIRVLLPARTLKESDVNTQAAEVTVTKRKGTILVVDDEEMVLLVTEDILRDAGYGVFTAPNGRAGLDLFIEHQSEISVVLLDLTMPKMDGYEVLTELQRIQPHVRVILTSGYSEALSRQRLAPDQLVGFIQKPYRPQQLVAKIDQVLAG